MNSVENDKPDTIASKTDFIGHVAATIQKYQMAQAGDRVMVCVSGGADSLALLFALFDLKEQLGIRRISACHFNHGLRGDESDADEQMVAKTCAGLGIELARGQGNMRDIGRPKGESEESFARKLRYNFFEQAAAECGADKIAMAHNQNDMAETALFHLARGAGIRGLRGIPPVRGRYIRPLIEIGRPEIEKYCQARGIMYAQDSSNADAVYARNRLRLRVIPELEKINSAAVDHIARACAKAAELTDYIEEQARETLKEAEIHPGGYDINCLQKSGRLVIKYVMKHLIETLGVQPSEARVDLCAGLLTGERREVQLADGIFLCAEGGLLIVHDHHEKTPELFETELIIGENAFFENSMVMVRQFCGPEWGKFKKRSKFILNNALDCDKIEGALILRNRRTGDLFMPARRGGTRKLKKLLNEAGVPARQRNQIPIITDSSGILWVAGQGSCQRVSVTDETKEIMYIEFSAGDGM